MLTDLLAAFNECAVVLLLFVVAVWLTFVILRVVFIVVVSVSSWLLNCLHYASPTFVLLRFLLLLQHSFWSNFSIVFCLFPFHVHFMHLNLSLHCSIPVGFIKMFQQLFAPAMKEQQQNI